MSQLRNHKSELPGAELVIGLVGEVGANLPLIAKDLSIALAKYEYGVKEIRVSGLIEKIVEVPPEKSGDEFNRIDIMMTAGDEARKSTEEDSILALVAVSHIYAARNEGRTRPREAFIINSLKHPEEVNALRRIYGNGFFLITFGAA